MVSIRTLNRGEQIGLHCDNQSPEFFSVRLDEGSCTASTAGILHTDADALSPNQVRACVALLEDAPGAT